MTAPLQLPVDAIPMKPKLRGHSHQAAFFVALGGGLMLVAVAPTARSTFAAAVYVVTCVALFGVSALYHRPMWPTKTRALLARVDHANIFVAIGGTYTPFCLLALSPQTGTFMLVTTWIGAGMLALAKLLALPMPRWLSTASYVALGWFAVWALPEAVGHVGAGIVALIVVGGVLYTLGALVYWRKTPNPVPNVFGYHEVFHAFVVAAGVLHFVAVAKLVLAAT